MPQYDPEPAGRCGTASHQEQADQQPQPAECFFSHTLDPFVGEYLGPEKKEGDMERLLWY
jgi:hypothetical protein